MLLGAVGPVAALQWRSGRWLGAARWIARNSSPHVLYATPLVGLLVACVGLSIIWPPAIVLVFIAAGAFMWALLASPLRRQTETSEARETPRAGRSQAAGGVSGPFSSRPEEHRRADRVRSGRRAPVRRARPGQAAARRDARRAG